jgi:hypothetical protein
MAVSFTIELLPTQRTEFRERVRWIKERIPTKEFHITRNFSAGGEPYWDSADHHLMAEVSVWSDDADRVALEFWFKFP